MSSVLVLPAALAVVPADVGGFFSGVVHSGSLVLAVPVALIADAAPRAWLTRSVATR